MTFTGFSFTPEDVFSLYIGAVYLGLMFGIVGALLAHIGRR